MPKIIKCEKCKQNLYIAYIRVNKKRNRIWKSIGFYCIQCEVLFDKQKVLRNEIKKQNEANKNERIR